MTLPFLNHNHSCTFMSTFSALHISQLIWSSQQSHGGYYYHHHFTDGETEARSDEITCLKYNSWKWKSWDSNPGSLALEPFLSNRRPLSLGYKVCHRKKAKTHSCSKEWLSPGEQEEGGRCSSASFLKGWLVTSEDSEPSPSVHMQRLASWIHAEARFVNSEAVGLWVLENSQSWNKQNEPKQTV